MEDENFFQFIWHEAKWLVVLGTGCLFVFLGTSFWELLAYHSWEAFEVGGVCFAVSFTVSSLISLLRTR